MIIFFDTSEKLDIASTEIGMEGFQLVTPLTGRVLQNPDRMFAIDNGAFGKKGFQIHRFRSVLARDFAKRHLCKFVAVPDIVGNAMRTRDVFNYWKNELKDWNLAYVCQDGQDNVPIPFKDITAIFIGGSTKWKESQSAKDCVTAAKMCEKWIHIGRINTPARLEAFEQLGADSCDGTGISQYSYMREAIKNRNNEHRLFPLESLISI